MIGQDTIKRGLQKGWNTYLTLVKIIIPVHILVTILKYTPLIEILATWVAPVMKHLGLSGEAILALISGYLLNNYAALGVVTGLDFSIREITILGTMLGISHALIIEAAVIKRIKVKILPLVCLRILVSLLTGYILNLLL
ncbi:nucleoside recognition domain-containing protein [Acetohalobium arabaticum]|uniref:Nucleoside recognition domain protein n=1 Tax=Acetohalobium arabaticum (strain ATCC 49924 / DSM 5501 / Z-7288) TaxID=574087 RepID=D9QRZ2_ACEAZ|nr:nucleoside recognition domain-containing protein [Acetohalobium arabaticum]ADL13283.1 nucleoside recognition domain protein [Acetohalobium arabaticum DSM 5501]